MSDMQHLDEGQLHAYLDGQRQGLDQHLAECAACRARLEEERRVRDRARAILGATGPTRLAPPPFEAVVERAARRQVSRRRFSTVPLAWAASLALALTAGWYARGLLMRTGPAGEVGRVTASHDQDVRADAIQAAPPVTRQLAQGGPAREEVAQPSRAADAPAPAAPFAQPLAAPVAQDRPLANVAATEAKAERDTVLTAARPADLPAPSVAAPTQAMRARIEPRGAVAEPSDEAWVTVTPAEAERRLGGPLATIPGLPSLGTSVSGTGPSTVARTIQVLGPGLTIQLVQQRTATAAVERAARERAAAPAAMPQAGRAMAGGEEPGRSLTVQWGEGFSVTGRALVPADSLQKLLGRLRRP